MGEERKSERMGAFFDVRSGGYDQHMQENVDFCTEFYQQIGLAFEPTNTPIQLLDLGCGTGLELAEVFEQVPNAVITAVDLSLEMLKLLMEKYSSQKEQIEVVQHSYLTWDYPQDLYDYVLSAMTVHHLVQEEKVELYKKIRASLRADGKYIEGDYIVSPDKEIEYLERYYKLKEELSDISDGNYHIDIPFSVETQLRLFREAGFSQVNLKWQKAQAVVFEARK